MKKGHLSKVGVAETAPAGPIRPSSGRSVMESHSAAEPERQDRQAKPHTRLRPELATDAVAIHSLTEEAFTGVPHSDGSERQVVGALRDAGALAVSIVAEAQGRVVGQVTISAVTLTDGSAGW